jgi:hypothetical protein
MRRLAAKASGVQEREIPIHDRVMQAYRIHSRRGERVLGEVPQGGQFAAFRSARLNARRAAPRI